MCRGGGGHRFRNDSKKKRGLFGLILYLVIKLCKSWRLCWKPLRVGWGDRAPLRRSVIWILQKYHWVCYIPRTLSQHCCRSWPDPPHSTWREIQRLCNNGLWRHHSGWGTPQKRQTGDAKDFLKCRRQSSWGDTKKWKKLSAKEIVNCRKWKCWRGSEKILNSWKPSLGWEAT